MLKKSLLMTTGSVVFVVGMILFPLPVPFGLPTMIVGLSIMLKASNDVKRLIIRLFKLHPRTEKLWRNVRALRRLSPLKSIGNKF
ncbi:hypothetical protein [Methylobacter luteus]|uniref:hypothetical protein n=1 Tax=Methylobacter luteus TaxID=415 RepID=UPI00040135C6|nr:hypothetical protein [Methylobacter luteus]